MFRSKFVLLALLALAGLAALAAPRLARAVRDYIEPWNRPGYGRML